LFVFLVASLFKGNQGKMKSYSDSDPDKMFCCPFDQGSEAFRQKMFRHFEFHDCEATVEAGAMPEWETSAAHLGSVS
jgi:hypothetical protein